MRWVILGGSGNLGATLASLASKRGHEVLGTFSRRPPDLPDVRFVQWDARLGSPPRELSAWKPDVVLHAVAIINPDSCAKDPQVARQINAESVRHSVALAGDALLVYISSDYVFDGRKGDYSECDPPNPVNLYGETKLAGERHAVQARRGLIVRTALFGSGLGSLAPTRTEQQLEALERGEEVVAACDQVGTPLWTRTLGELIPALVEKDATGIVHAAGPEALDKAELLRRLSMASGIPAPRVRGATTAELKPLAERPLNVALRCSSVVSGLPGYPTTLAQEFDRYATSRCAAARRASSS